MVNIKLLKQSVVDAKRAKQLFGQKRCCVAGITILTTRGEGGGVGLGGLSVDGRINGVGSI